MALRQLSTTRARKSIRRAPSAPTLVAGDILPTAARRLVFDDVREPTIEQSPSEVMALRAKLYSGTDDATDDGSTVELPRPPFMSIPVDVELEEPPSTLTAPRMTAPAPLDGAAHDADAAPSVTVRLPSPLRAPGTSGSIASAVVPISSLGGSRAATSAEPRSPLLPAPAAPPVTSTVVPLRRVLSHGSNAMASPPAPSHRRARAPSPALATHAAPETSERASLALRVGAALLGLALVGAGVFTARAVQKPTAHDAASATTLTGASGELTVAREKEPRVDRAPAPAAELAPDLASAAPSPPLTAQSSPQVPAEARPAARAPRRLSLTGTPSRGPTQGPRRIELDDAE